MMRSIFYIIICASWVVSCPGDELALPDDDFYPGWIKTEQAYYFKGRDLFNHINGGAELFLEFGFVDLVVQRYANGEDEIGFEVYRMECPEAALGIYLLKCGREIALPQLGIRHSYNRFQVTAVRGNYFCLVNNYSGDEAHAPAMRKLLALTLSDVASGNASALFDHLPPEGLMSGSELIIRGLYGLQPIFTFGEGDMLQLAGKVFAVLGDYRHQGDEYSRIVVAYPDSGSATSTWYHLLENLDSFLHVTDKNDSVLVFKDYNDEYGRIQVSGSKIDIAIHLTSEPDL